LDEKRGFPCFPHAFVWKTRDDDVENLLINTGLVWKKRGLYVEKAGDDMEKQRKAL